MNHRQQEEEGSCDDAGAAGKGVLNGSKQKWMGREKEQTLFWNPPGYSRFPTPMVWSHSLPSPLHRPVCTDLGHGGTQKRPGAKVVWHLNIEVMWHKWETGRAGLRLGRAQGSLERIVEAGSTISSMGEGVFLATRHKPGQCWTG